MFLEHKVILDHFDFWIMISRKNLWIHEQLCFAWTFGWSISWTKSKVDISNAKSLIYNKNLWNSGYSTKNSFAIVAVHLKVNVKIAINREKIFQVEFALISRKNVTSGSLTWPAGGFLWSRRLGDFKGFDFLMVSVISRL